MGMQMVYRGLADVVLELTVLDARLFNSNPRYHSIPFNSNPRQTVTVATVIPSETASQPFSNWIDSFSLDEIRGHQLSDTDVGPVLNWKLSGCEAPSPESLRHRSGVLRRLCGQWDDLVVLNGILYRKWKSKTCQSTEEMLQLVLPKIQ